MPAKLKIDTVRLIKRYGADGYTVTDLAQRFSVSTSCIKNVLSGKTHANVVDDPDLPLLSEVTPPPEPDRRRKSPSPSPSPTPAGPTPLGSRPGDIRRVPSPAPKHRPRGGTPAAASPSPTPPGPRPGDVQPSPTPPDTRREPEPDVQPDPETWATSAAGVYHTGTEALDVQPGPVDVQPDPEPDPDPTPTPTDPESWGAKPFEPRRRGRR